MAAVKKTFSVIIDMLIMYFALMLSIPCFEDGIGNKEVRSFLRDIHGIPVLMFSVIFTIAAAVIESALIKKGVLSMPDDDAAPGFMAKLWRFIKGGLLVLGSITLGALAVGIVREVDLSEIFCGIIIIVAALFIQKGLKGNNSVLGRFSNVVFDIYISMEQLTNSITESIKDTLGKYFLFAIGETILCLVPIMLGKGFMYEAIKEFAEAESIHKYTIAEAINVHKLALLPGSDAVSADGVFGGILNAEISFFLFSFLLLMPIGCMVGGMLCLFFKAGTLGSFTRKKLGELNDYIESLPANYEEHSYVDKDGNYHYSTSDWSLHGFMVMIRFVIIYPLSLILNMLFGPLLPLDIILNLILGLLAKFSPIYLDDSFE